MFRVLRTVILLSTAVMALDDLPVYLDAGCDSAKTTGKLSNGYAQGPAEMVLADKGNGQKTITVTCTEKLSGSDAIVLKLPRSLKSGEYWDFGIKFADDRAHSLKGFVDVRFFAKNRAATPAKFRFGWEALGTSNPKMKVMEIPANSDWTEYVVPLTEIGGDSVYGLKLSQATDTYGGADLTVGPLDVLIDSARATDGTGLHGLDLIPGVVHNPVPANWGPNFILGSFDNRELGKSTKAQQAGLPYRYQYVMPDIKTYYSRSGKGYVYDYAMFSDTLGVKTAIVWYNLGKVGEGWDPVTKNLADATYMASYFERYDWVLDQLAMAGQSDYMIVVEPDMYGFLMRGPGGATGTPVDDPTRIAVNMTKANALSGKTYESTMVGWAKYLVARAKEKLPKGVIIGHMPNHWGVSIPGQVGQGRKESHYISGMTIGRFLAGFGKDGLGDVVFVEKSDHDAGHKPTNENWFWDSTAYSKYFLWTRCIAAKTGLPICGWQVSEGNMTNTTKLLQDDAAATFIAHPQWWIDGGFTGILFGAGNADCANYKDDNDAGWFVDHLTTASKTPIPLSTPSAVAPRATDLPKGIRMASGRDGIRFEGFEGSATVAFLDARGKIGASHRVRAGESIAWPASRHGAVFVRVRAEGATKVFAVTR